MSNQSASFEDFKCLAEGMFEMACDHSTATGTPVGAVLAGVIFHLSVEAQLNDVPEELIGLVVAQSAEVFQSAVPDQPLAEASQWALPQTRSPAVLNAPVAAGTLLSDAILDGHDMCSMNFARLEHQNLSKILVKVVIPAMGGYSNPLAGAIAVHLEHMVMFSGNYCWKHRHVGAAHGEVGKRPGDVKRKSGAAQ